MRLFSLHKNRRFLGIGFAAFAILFVTLFSAFNSQPVSAATNLSDETSAETMFKAIKYYHAIDSCASKGFFKETITGNDIGGGPRLWIAGGTGGVTNTSGVSDSIDIGMAIDRWGNKNGSSPCRGESDSEPGWVNEAFTMFGLNPGGGATTLQKMGYACTINNGTQTCTKSDIDKTILSTVKNSTYLKGSEIGSTSSTTYKVATYWGAINTLRGACGAVEGGTTNIVQDIPVYQTNGSIALQDWSLGKTGNVVGSVVPLNGVYQNTDSCNSDLVNAAKNNVNTYQLWASSPICKSSFPSLASDASALGWCALGRTNASNPTYCATAPGIQGFNQSTFTAFDYRNACFLGAGHPVDSSGTTAGVLCMGLYSQSSLLTACINGAKNKSNTTYCSTTYADASLQTAKEACAKGAALPVTGGGALLGETADPDAAAGEVNSCVIDGVGWLVCPAITFLANIADEAFVFLEDNFLNIDVALFSSGSGTYDAWSVMRTFANIAFVIAFLIIIFSQLTGAGITNYGVKKLLPKLVISAILVNISFFLCQLAVDLSNIVGVSIKNLFDSIANTTTGAHYSVGDSSGNWAGIAAAVLAGASVAWALGLAVLLPLLLGAVVSILMTLLILILREVLVVLLIAISPLAFVAYLLPNTEQWFKKWSKMFVSLLLVYPTVGLLYGASSLASGVLKTAYDSSGDVIGQSVAAGVLFLPLFLLLPMLRNALKATGAGGAWLAKKASMGEDGLGRKTKSKVGKSGLVQNYGARKAEKKAAISTGRYVGRNPISRLRSRANKGLNNSALFNATTGGYGATRTLDGQRQERKDTQEAMAMFGNDDVLVEEWAKSGGDIDKVPAGVLNENQKQQFMLLKNAGHAKKSTSFTAAAQYLSENGKGSSKSFVSALQNARAKGANDTDIDGAWASGMAAYRKAGRGDTVGELQYAMNLNKTNNGARAAANQPPQTLAEEMVGQGGFNDVMEDSDPVTKIDLHMARTNAWKEVAPSSVHRDGIKFNSKDASGADLLDANGVPLKDATGRVIAAAKSDGYQAYESHIRADRQHLMSALSGYNSMEARSQKAAYHAILEAAQDDQAAQTGQASTITNIQEAKNHFKIK